MTRIKQISSWIIALAGLMIATGVVQAQQYDFKYNGLYYKKTKIISTLPVLHYEVKVVPEKAVYPHYSAGNEPKGAVTIPKSFTQGHIYTVKEIGDNAFYGCKDLTGITIPNSVHTIGKNVFFLCRGLTTIDIPSGLTTINREAFSTCFMSAINIPSSVTTIGEEAFRDCNALKTVTVHWDTPLDVPDNIFSRVETNRVTLEVPAGKEAAYRAAPVWEDFKIGVDNPPVPGDGGKLTITDITHESFKVHWASATDDVWPQNKLRYVLFCKNNKGNNWSKGFDDNPSPFLVSAVPDAEYEISVDVIDKIGNRASYETKRFKTLPAPDVTPPVPGNGGKLTVTDVTSSGFTVSWEKATDDKAPQEKLIYKVYCKKSKFFVPQFMPADLKATLTDKASYTITGLGGSITIINPALDKGYDVNVEVEDEDGSSAWYNEENVKLASATVAVTGVTVAPAALTLEVGQTGALTATVTPTTATNKAVTWTSSAPAIATVDASGTVKGIATGTATITVKTADGGKTATCAVTVKEAAAPPVKVTGITLNYSSITVNGDLERVQLIATVAPATATDQSLTWTSSDASVASVDGAGLVTIRKKGKATVTAKANDGSGVSASCLFDVIRTVANETIDGLRIYAADGALRLALPAPETVHIHNVEGSLVKTLILPAGDHVQPLPSGVYVVRVGERVAKVMVK